MNVIDFTKAKNNKLNSSSLVTNQEKSGEKITENDFIMMLDTLVKTEAPVIAAKKKTNTASASTKKDGGIGNIEKYLQDLRRRVTSDMRKIIVDINVSETILNEHPRRQLCDIVLPQSNYSLAIRQDKYEVSLSKHSSPIIIEKPKIKIIFRNLYTYIEKIGTGYIVITNQNIKLNENIISFCKDKDILSMVVKNLVDVSAKDRTLEFGCLDGADFTDNDTLLISQEEEKVYLPYKIEKVRREAKAARISVEQLINEKYVIPMENYKYSISARYKEAYKLVKEREKKSTQRAILLGIELMFDFSLHPAVISACNSIDELDLYLDCLEGKKLDKFSCFKIAYKALPMLSKVRKHIMQGT